MIVSAPSLLTEEEKTNPQSVLCSVDPHVTGEAEVEPSVKLYYEVYGSPEATEKLLLVMGLGTAGTAWLHNVEGIMESESDFQICIYDNRGVGRSSVPSGRYTTKMMAGDAVALADHLGWDRFHVAGVSMGGMISQEIAFAAPHRVATLNLGVTHAGGFRALPPLKGLQGILRTSGAKTSSDRINSIMEMMYPPEWLAEQANEQHTWKDIIVRRFEAANLLRPLPDPGGYRSQALAVQTHSVGKARLKALRESDIPVLVCVGTKDLLVRPGNSFYLKEMLEPSEFIVWDDAGHGIIFHKAQEYNEALIRHCRRNPINAPSSTVEGQRAEGDMKELGDKVDEEPQGVVGPIGQAVAEAEVQAAPTQDTPSE